MNYKVGDSLEEWSKKVQLFEYGYALQELANGKDIQEILVSMSERIANKMIHPIMDVLNDKTLTEIERIDLEVGRIRYQREYIDRFCVKPEHNLDGVAGKQQ